MNPLLIGKKTKLLSNNKQFHSSFKQSWAILLNMTVIDLQSTECLTTGFAIPHYNLDFQLSFKGHVTRLCKEVSEFCFQDGLIWE